MEYIIGIVFFILYMLTVGALINQIAQLGVAVTMANIHKLSQTEARLLEMGVRDGTTRELNGFFALLRVLVSYSSVVLVGILLYSNINLVTAIIGFIIMFVQVSIFHVRSIEDKLNALRSVMNTGDEEMFHQKFSIKPLAFGLFVFAITLIGEILTFNALV